MSTIPLKEHYDEALNTLKSGDVEEAELICRRTLPHFGRDPNILCLLGEICIRRRRPQEARHLFAEVLGRQPGFPRALEGIGLALLADKKPADAAEYLVKAAAAAPKRSKTRIALARALAESGHYAESEKAIRKAFDLNPRQAALNQVEIALAEGRLEEAEKQLREILVQDPQDVKALRMLASIAVEASRFRPARKMLERAVALNPGFVPAWNDLANLLMKQDRYDEALDAVQRALDIDPKMVQTWITRANILTRAQRNEESLETYGKALELSPRNAGALSGMGHVLKTIGQQEKSIEAFRQCIKAHPAYGEAYWSLANLKTFEFNDEEVRVMEKMVADDQLADEPRVNFFLSLGKHYENEKDYDRAFDHYRRGNDLRREHEVYDPVQTQVVHDRIIKVFSQDFLQEREGWGDPDAAPILVVGLPRSGSTLIEQILASHSMVEGTMELPDLSRVIADLSKASPRGVEYPEAVLELDEDAVGSLGRAYLQSTMRYRTGKAYFIDKMPNNFPSIGFLQLILPNAKVIDARRHPLDSCLGSYKQLFFKGQSFTYDHFELGHYYLEYRRIMNHWASTLPGKVLDVHYEQMVTDQENQTRRLLEYCGLPWEDQCLRFYETERAINTASSEQVRQPIYTGAMNFWRNYEPHLGELIETLELLLRELPPEDQPSSFGGK
ncbi:MAG: sulfotransferase [Gammaproteobacteria bacterium]|nr:sulfotransferase [Gammaproteobacteria bacterium]